jgi:DNA uptake protein ComE-like DNA-binding protein
MVAVASLAWSPLLAQTPQPAAPSTARPATTSPAPSAPAATAPATPTTKTPLIDINSASKDELDALPGIGAVRAEAIIKGRPYKGKDELLRKKVLPSNVYEGIKDRIVARQS